MPFVTALGFVGHVKSGVLLPLARRDGWLQNKLVPVTQNKNPSDCEGYKLLSLCEVNEAVEFLPPSEDPTALAYSSLLMLEISEVFVPADDPGTFL